MPTIGNTVTPSQTYGSFGLNVCDTLAILVTMPQAGTLQSVTCYFDGQAGGGTITARTCVWDINRNLVAQSANLSIPAGSGGIGGQAFHTGTLTSPYTTTNGQQLYLGFWRFATQSMEWTENNGGTEYQFTQDSNNNSSPPSGFGAWNTTSGTPSFYATYTTGGIRVRRSGAWVTVIIQVRRSGVWVLPTVFVRRTGSWVQVQ